MRLLHLFVDGLLCDSLFLLPVITLIGLLLAKNSFGRSLAGALAVLVGWVVILLGLFGILAALGGLDGLLGTLVTRGGKGVAKAALDPTFTVAGPWAHAQVLAVLLAYAINIIWARFSPARYLFLNPIHVLLATAMLSVLFFRVDASLYVGVLVTGVLVGSIMAWLPYVARRPFDLMGDDDVALGSMHTGLLLGVAFVATKLGAKGGGKKSDDEEELDGANIKSPIFFAGAVIGGLALLLSLNAGPDETTAALKGVGVLALAPSAGSTAYLVGPLLLGFLFAGGFWILMHGIPLVTEGVGEAFVGWQKLLPGTKPAMDALFMLGDAPRDVVTGFLLSLTAGTFGYYLFGWIGLTAVVPGMLVAVSAGHLIGGGAAATIAARIGGQRALWILAPLHGLVLSFLASAAFSVSMGLSKAKVGVATELSDLSVLDAILSGILHLFN